jgi:hypothetical protein
MTGNYSSRSGYVVQNVNGDMYAIDRAVLHRIVDRSILNGLSKDSKREIILAAARNHGFKVTEEITGE